MGIGRRNRTVFVGLGAAVLLAIGAWVAGAQIKSPAQIAAETAAPDPSSITVPVERRVLSSEVIVRGTVRYGSPQPVVLATSTLKQNSAASGGTDIVTTRPRRGARVGEGSLAMSVSGRPVFVLRGAQPSHRDIQPGSRGQDVRQLEQALARMGYAPGAVDGRYDGATASAVARWYERAGWTPFGATDTQLDQLRAARAAAAAARDAFLQARIAARGGTPAEIAQARIDLQTAREAAITAEHDLASQRRAVAVALANERRDNALATADTALKQAAVNKARYAQIEAQRNLVTAPPDTSPAERAALEAAVRAAGDDVSVAQADLNAASSAARATREAGRDAVVKARADRRRAEKALPSARRQVRLASRRLRIMINPTDNGLQQLVIQAAGREARSTQREVSRLARKVGISVPADEVLFFSTLPLRVDSVRVRRGDPVSGRVMTVSNSRLAIDSSLSITDAKLVRPGAQVEIEEPDLGIKTTGVVSQVADSPGTHKVEQGRVYVAITPKSAPAQLVGASVKLTIAVKSTDKAVLTVPITSLSVGADGTSRVQVQRNGGRSEYVSVEPGLAAQGLVEVRPVRGSLTPGELVVAGKRDGSAGAGAGPATSADNGGTTGGSGSTGASGATGSGSSGTTGGSQRSGATGGGDGSSGSSGTTP
jgi:hypothetical protein